MNSIEILEELLSEVRKNPRKRMFLVGRTTEDQLEMISKELHFLTEKLIFIKLIIPSYSERGCIRWRFMTV